MPPGAVGRRYGEHAHIKRRDAHPEAGGADQADGGRLDEADERLRTPAAQVEGHGAGGRQQISVDGVERLVTGEAGRPGIEVVGAQGGRAKQDDQYEQRGQEAQGWVVAGG